MSSSFHVLPPTLIKTKISKNIHEALKVLKWREVIMEEIRALEKNKTWDVIELPVGVYDKVQGKWDNRMIQNPTSCKNVYTYL